MLLQATEIPSILKQLTSPLQLAGLILLVGAAIIKFLPDKDKTAGTKRLLNLGFVLALVFGVGAMVKGGWDEYNGRVLRVAGIVRDMEGHGIANARIDILGIAAGVSNSEGKFDFNIPSSWKKDQYTLLASAAAYLPYQQNNILPDALTELLIDMKPAAKVPLVADQVIGEPHNVFIGHLVGVPMVIMNFNLMNPLATPLEVTTPAMDLVDPNGRTYPITMLDLLTPGNTTPQPPQPLVPLIPNMTWPIQCRFGGTSGELGQLTIRTHTESSAKNMRIEPGYVHYSIALTNECRDVMRNNFIYIPGEWKLRMHCVADGTSLQRVFGFTLAKDDLIKLRSIAKYYDEGYGLFPNIQAFWDHKDGHSYVQVNVVEQ